MFCADVFCAEPVREFAPPYEASDTEAAEQCFEPYSENRRFSEWVDPDGVATKTKGTPCGVPLFSLVSQSGAKSNEK